MRKTDQRESLTFIWLALLPKFTGSLNSRFTSMFVQIRIAHDLATNEFVLKIRVDDASRLRRLCSLSDGPRTNFIRPTSEIPNQLCQARVSAMSAERASQRTNKLTSSEVYPACVILPNALVEPMFFSSSAFSSAVRGARRSSSATEKGMSGSPVLFASIQALIRGNLSLIQHASHINDYQFRLTICSSSGYNPSRKG